MQQTGILTVGGAYLDINADHFPFSAEGLLPETEVVGGAYELAPGGSAVNFARLCSSLGLPATFIGKIGGDPLGGILADEMRAAGVRPELVVDREVMTNLGLNFTNKDGKSVMAVVGTANHSLTAREVRERVSLVLSTVDYFFIGGCFKLKALMPAFDDLVNIAHEEGAKVVLDHARLNSRTTTTEKTAVRALVHQIDYYLPSVDEFCELWDFASLEEGLLQFTEIAPETTVVVKDGGRGAATVMDGKVVRVPAFDVQLIHTVGAGDSFNAGFIAATEAGRPLLDSMRFGCATAALKISSTALPTRAGVDAFLRAKDQQDNDKKA